MRTKSIILVAFMSIITLMLCIVFFSQKWAINTAQEYQHNPTAVKKIIDAHTYFDTLPVFQLKQKTRDAGILLNKHIGLDDGTEADENVWWTFVEGNELIKENWLDKPEALLNDNGTAKFDDSILKELLAYDYWDPKSSGAYAALLKTPPKVEIMESPIPNLIGIQYLAKVRLSRAIHEKNILPALKEIRHLGRLCLGHEQLVDSMIALAIFSIERNAALKAIEDGLITEDDWSYISDKDIKKARALIWSSISLYDFSTEHTAEPFIQHEMPLEKCAIMMEAGVRMLLYKTLLDTPRWPMEADFFTPIKRFEDDWKVSGCELPALKQYWNIKEPLETLPDSEVVLFKIPYYRMITTTILISVGPTADYTNDYPLDDY